VTKERAAELVEELTPMMIESRKSMDPERMATMHNQGSRAICLYILAIYNIGAEQLDLPPFELHQCIQN